MLVIIIRIRVNNNGIYQINLEKKLKYKQNSNYRWWKQTFWNKKFLRKNIKNIN